MPTTLTPMGAPLIMPFEDLNALFSTTPAAFSVRDAASASTGKATGLPFLMAGLQYMPEAGGAATDDLSVSDVAALGVWSFASFDDVQDFVVEGQILSVGGARYTVAPSAATDMQVTTASGVKLYFQTVVLESGSTNSGLTLSSGETYDNGTSIVPRVPLVGLLNIEDELKFWPDLSGDGDYDADIIARGNFYHAAGARHHFRTNIDFDTGATATEGRVVVGTTPEGINYIQSGREFSGATILDFAIGPYNSSNWWLYVAQDTRSVGINNDDPKGRLHIQNSALSALENGGTINTSAMGLVVDETGGNTGITIVTDNDALGQIAFADPDDNNIGGIRYDHADDSMSFHAGNAPRLVVHGNGEIEAANLPTTAPVDSNRIWNDGGTLKITS